MAKKKKKKSLTQKLSSLIKKKKKKSSKNTTSKKKAQKVSKKKKASPKKTRPIKKTAGKTSHKTSSKKTKKLKKKKPAAPLSQKATASKTKKASKKTAQTQKTAQTKKVATKKSTAPTASSKPTKSKVEKTEVKTTYQDELKSKVRHYMENPIEDTVITDADGRAYCTATDCDQIAQVERYCRYHYLSLWRVIQKRRKILAENQIVSYLQNIMESNSLKMVYVLYRDFSNERDFMDVLQELYADELSIPQDDAHNDTSDISDGTDLSSNTSSSFDS